MPQALLLALLTTLLQAERPDIVLADFEAPTYGVWQAVGAALGNGPARGTLPNQMPVSGFVGRGLVNTYHGGDGTVGSLTSPPFVIERRYLNYRLGGGRDEQKLTFALLVDGKAVRTATGPNDKPGGTERLEPAFWDLGDLAGQTAVLRITDEATGGWGHINVDHIVLSDRKAAIPVAKTVELMATGRYLHLPVRNGGDKTDVTLTGEGLSRHFDIELATDGTVDWWAPCDLGAKPPAKVTLHVAKAPEELDLAKLPRFADRLLDADNLYAEALRPQFHFSARRGWINDPNGLVWADGEWHLYFQHNPYGVQWGNMHWGHAVSPDLLHWTELDEALFPDPLGPMFSGSAVIDEQRTSGLGAGAARPPLVAIYTAAGTKACQCIAWSTDRGRTLTKIEGNPVLPHLIGGNRDPKVIWYAPERKWVMALYLDGEDFALFESKDLKAWTKTGDVKIPGCSECPEFFEIGIEGRPGETRWVFYGGNGRYLVGRFDGKTFTPESGPHEMHRGNCWYASQTYNGVPAADGRRILVAWGQVQLPGMPFNQQMAFPIELTLHAEPEGLRLRSAPAREIARLRTKAHTLPAGAIADGVTPLPEVKGGLYDLELVIEPGAAQTVGLNVRGFAVTYDVAQTRLTVNGPGAEAKLVDGRLRLRLLVDRASIEAWAQDGRVYIPAQAVAGAERQAVELVAKGAGARLVSGTVHELKSVWK